jgi:diguanylate cyclase (GGDEF)-like protein
VDIDHFKVVNDTYGHQAGDFLLKEFAAIFRGMVRPYDLLARYGGEEFILLTANSDRSRTQAAIQRVLDVVRGKAFLFNGTEIRFTFSGGICDTGEFAEPERTPERLISTADTRLYAAKEAGRNRISAG